MELLPQGSPIGAPTTDFALIESQKENIRPLATGRSAVTLSSVLKEPSAADKLLQEGHEKHRKAIEEADKRDNSGEDMIDGLQDVLDVYILFTVQHHPSSDNHLLPLLETTTRRFINDARYAQDVRYLKLWIMYARQIDRREEIWAFLESRDIGTRHSSFYEEWSTTLEGLGRRKKADEIYRLGIARKALPTERLKSRHKQFLDRIMASSSGTIPEDSLPSASARTPSRAVLGQVRSTGASGLSGVMQLAPSLRSTSGAQNGKKLDIFSDETGKGEVASAGEWADFGGRSESRKENTIEPGPWKGETLPQSATRGKAPRTPKIEVFQDGEGNDAMEAHTGLEVFSRHKQPPTEAELLKLDPLRHYDISNLSTEIPSLPAPPSTRKPPRPNRSSTQPLQNPSNRPNEQHVMQPWTCPTDGPFVTLPNGKKERRMFNWDLVYKDGEEWSFEEIRSKQRGLYGKGWRGEVKEWERAWHKPGSTTPQKSKPKEERAKPPSPTVNTKLAELEVMKMFDQTIHGGKIRDSDSDSDTESEEDAEAAQVAPTPLPTRGTAQMLAPTPGGFVPLTPTPSAASRLFSDENVATKSAVSSNTNTISKPTFFPDENACRHVVYSDEDNVPTSAFKKFSVFSDTPSGAETPVCLSSSSKVRTFGIFSDENVAPARTSDPPSQRQPLVLSNIFAMSALEESTLFNRATESIGELAENEQEERNRTNTAEETAEQAAKQTAQPSLSEASSLRELVNEDYDEYELEPEEEQPRAMRRFVVNTMTPITERTCEFTQTTGRGSLAPETLDEEDEGEEDEEEENIKPVHTVAEQSDCDTIHNGLSGEADSAFQLPDGYTIHKTDQSSGVHTMVLVDNEDEPSISNAQDKLACYTATDGQLSLGELPNPCDPTSEHTSAALLDAIEPSLTQLPGFVDNREITSGKLHALQKHIKSKLRRASTSSRASTSGDDAFLLTLDGKSFEIRDKLGEGGFGVVFLGVDVELRRQQDETDSDNDDDENDEALMDKSLVAVKIEKPGAVWETVILDRVHRRVNDVLRASIIHTRNLYLFKDESFLILDYCPQGTLLDVVNKSTTLFGATSPGVDELLAMFFIIELLKLVEGLHEAEFLHGDLKIDNCLVRILDMPSSSWSAAYSPTGADGWSAQGIRLIDFGRAIDFSLFPRGQEQTFKTHHQADEGDCTEMRMGKSWRWETDYFGIAGVAYCLLFGKHMKTEIFNGRVKIDQSLKRYWQVNLWTNLFEMLLNPGTEFPITSQLREIRRELERWLQENCQKGGKSLKSLLRKIELAATTGKKL
ncbi:uncharacterized protein L203_101546 [Cryptococcus depauperatus CBS 7841]|uniref:BUB protein kinase n=1 Tax=Cryptococcus depauperatus CBS 7841 TaxID=1295531 RepID=A0AAJ8JQ70_9TREE